MTGWAINARIEQTVQGATVVSHWASGSPLPREREPAKTAPFLEAWQRSQLGMVLELLPLAEKVVQEAERSPEWANNSKLACAKQGLEEIRMLREQSGRTEPKQRAGS